MSDKGKYKKQNIINTLIEMRTKKSMGVKSLLDYLMNDLGYAQAMAYNYIRDANETIKEIYQHNNIGLVESTISELEYVLQYAKESNNHKLWLEIKKEINKITGVYAPDKQSIEHSGKIESININLVDSIKQNKLDDPKPPSQ